MTNQEAGAKQPDGEKSLVPKLPNIRRPTIREITERKARHWPIRIACNLGVERSFALAAVLETARFTNVELFRGGMKRLHTLSVTELLTEDIPEGTHFVLIRDPNDSKQSAEAMEKTIDLIKQLEGAINITHEVMNSQQAAIIATNLGLNFKDFLPRVG